MIRTRIADFARLHLVISGTLLLGALGCMTAPRTINVAGFAPANRIEVYENGKPVIDRVVKPGSPEDRAVAAWLQLHAFGWRPTLVNYAPGQRVRGVDFDLNFQANQCVLNYGVDEKGGWAQVIRPLAADDPIRQIFARAE